MNRIIKISVGLAVVLGSFTAKSQNVGVNDNGAAPNANAILDVDISTNDKGVLIPRLTTVQRTAIAGLGATEEGLTVYDETTNSFWFWDGTQWKELQNAGSGGSGWSLTGDAGTTNGTNFIGTTDNQALDIRTDNVIRVRITSKGQIEVLNTGQSVFIGEGAGANDYLSYTQNTFVGYQSGNSNTTGYRNTASGNYSLYSNTTGNYNTASGYNSLYSNTTGYRNTASGNYSLYSNTTGNYNTASGYYSLSSNTTGYHNTASGYRSLKSNTTGHSNTALGNEAGSSGSSYSNRIAIGYNTQNSASDQVRIGNSSVTSIGGYANWSNVSDARFKKDIQENVVGLDFILQLRPVTYHLNMDAIASAYNTPDSLRLPEAEQVKGTILQTGFIAQEVEKTAQDLGYDFSGVDAPKNENDFYGLRYAEFVVPLVKATQELNEKNTKLEDENTKLKAQMQELVKRIERLERK